MSDHPESRVVLPAGDLQHFACKRKGRLNLRAGMPGGAEAVESGEMLRGSPDAGVRELFRGDQRRHRFRRVESLEWTQCIRAGDQEREFARLSLRPVWQPLGQRKPRRGALVRFRMG